MPDESIEDVCEYVCHEPERCMQGEGGGVRAYRTSGVKTSSPSM